MIRELFATLWDTILCGDLRGHLRSWWWVVTHPHLLDGPAPEPQEAAR